MGFMNGIVKIVSRYGKSGLGKVEAYLVGASSEWSSMNDGSIIG